MVHIKPPRCHHWRINIFPPIPPSLESGHRRNRYQVSVALRWKLASHRHLLQIVCHSGASWGAQKKTEITGHEIGTAWPPSHRSVTSRKTDWRRRLGVIFQSDVAVAQAFWDERHAVTSRCTTIALCSYCGPMSKEVNKKRIFIIPKDSCCILP